MYKFRFYWYLKNKRKLDEYNSSIDTNNQKLDKLKSQLSKIEKNISKLSLLENQDEIVKAIESSCVMVLIFSKNANSSEEIKKEMGLASENQLVLMPLRMDDTLATGGFKYNFATSQWIGLYQDFDENIETVVKTINTLTAKQDKFV